MIEDDTDSQSAGSDANRPGETAATRARKAAARERLAVELRDNLRRRKAQARGRQPRPDGAEIKEPPE